ncbi:GT1 glycosyltransferase [Synechococcus phage S-CBWM1]|uniref:GT1 glycosyltransferase n=1 Tax=Synechococcus phage S-CBWM1 TaxID=2053653 RepID=A0A3G1L3P6_9CAUD|nr:glycosyltransferase [Synechococcus phage S-CBWM1]ATW62806.1 GT1 glycosyltransferase [Synechococcus phage S-CBWM1]
MMRPFGYEVIEYSNAGSESEADEHVEMLSREEVEKFFPRKEGDFFGDVAIAGCRGHQIFEERLLPALMERVEPGDIVCHPFGHSHSFLLDKLKNVSHVETGIGYPTTMPGSFKIFESYAWMHYHQGKDRRNGGNFEWVIPNYFDLEDWEPSYEPGNYLAFLGRVCEMKGLKTIQEIANRTKYPVIVCGQGSIEGYESENIEFRGPISGRKRSEFLRNARAALMPTVFTEPFGGSGVEAMLCGTPLIAVDYGAFTETVEDGVTGFRCKLLSDWLSAIEAAGELDRRYIAGRARSLYSLERCGEMYDRAFRQIQTLWHDGWYATSY